MASDRILLTGATGYLGGKLIAPLLQEAASVHAIVRDSAKGDALVASLGPKFSYSVLNLDTESIEALKDLLRQATVFIHNAVMFTPEGVAFEAALTNAIIEVGDEAATSGRKFHFILTSGTLLYGEPAEGFSDSSSIENSNHLVAWKVPEENRLIAAAHGSFLVSIVRCTFIYPGTHVSTWAEQGKREGKLRVWANRSNKTGFIHIDDLTELYRLIIVKGAQGAFIGVDETPLTIAQVLEKVQELTGITEIEEFSNPFELLHSHGFFIYGQTVSQIPRTERAEELGWVRKHPSFLESPNPL